MTFRTAIWVVFRCAGFLALIGGAMGWALGRFFPGYYRSVFPGGGRPDFDPIIVGLVQGGTQGAAAGATLAIALVGVFVWRDIRIQELAVLRNSPADVRPPRTDSHRFPWMTGWLFSLACCLSGGIILGTQRSRQLETQSAHHARFQVDREVLEEHLRSDDAFREIEIEEHRLGFIGLRGHVATQDDLNRLRTLIRDLFGKSREQITFGIEVKN
ncbi:MAG: hypothetical protein NT069_21850 [Planctomycetota bacterium]|nr:hypothetical protein [Planctomycetota bacterium]